MPKFFNSKKINFLVLLVILIISARSYLTCLSADFVDWDDQIQVSNNFDIKILSAKNLQIIFTNYYAGMYQPLATLSFALENKFWHSFPLFLHLDNLLLHLLNVVLVYWLTKKLFKRSSFVPSVVEGSTTIRANFKKRDKIEGIALLSSALFAWHPIQVETVAWVSARSNLFLTTFSLLMLLAYITYCQLSLSPELPDKKIKRAKLTNYWLTFGGFVLALLSKAPAVILPLLLFVFDYYYHRTFRLSGKQVNKKIFLEKIPFLSLSLIFGWLAIKGRNLAEAIPPIIYPWWEKITFIAYSPLSYLQKILLPYNLSPFYALPQKINHHLPLIFYLSVPLFLVLFWLLYKYRHRRALILGVAWFLILILPSLQIKIFSGTLIADRYVYLAGVGIFWLISLTIFWLYQRFPNLKFLLLLASLFCLLSLSWQTSNQVGVWKNSLNLWTAIVNLNPQLASAYSNLGNAKAKNNDLTGALEAYQQALKLDNRDAFVYSNIGTLLTEKMSKPFEALNYYNQAIKLNPQEAMFHYNRGCILLKLNRLPEALKDYQTAVTLKSEEKYYNYVFLNSLANLEYRLNYFKEAARDYEQIIQTDPASAEAYYFLGLSKIKLNNKLAGCQDLTQADQLGYKEATKDYNNFCNK